MARVVTGLQRLIEEKEWSSKMKGQVAYLCHAASITKDLEHGLIALKKIFGHRLVKVFGPQHGFVTDVQDNMVESPHYVHPFFQLKVYSLYSETRSPTDEMLEGIDHLIIDLQDVGTRIYTYIYTMTLVLEACAKKSIEVIILDRPNPINGITLEGAVLDLNFASFVGRHPLPVRHSLTMGEVALMHQKYFLKPQEKKTSLTIIPMKGWKRSMSYEDTQLPWVLPSPNLATIEAAYTFVGTVLFEGTNISEGRGTTRSLEIIGHPGLEPFSFAEKCQLLFQKEKLTGFVLRPLVFLPTFQKHQGKACGGFQIHVTDRKSFEPWRLCQTLCREFYHHLGAQFLWKQPPYEYEYHKLPIDLINGGSEMREWVEKRGSADEFIKLNLKGHEDFKQKREECILYRES
jgi:uncharacterized protein YbbC (DUF1343 family)